MIAVEPVELNIAVALARAAVGAAEDVPGQPDPVWRLDRSAWYVLVRLGRAGEPGWLAAIDPRAHDVLSWAANPAGASTVPTRPPEVVAQGAAELVWRPCAQSRSPLYPLLRLSTAGGEVFVDLSGRVWPELSDGRA